MIPFVWFLWVMQAAVIILRLCGVIAWPWWVVLGLLEALVGLRVLGWVLERLAWAMMTPEERARQRAVDALEKLKRGLLRERGGQR